MYLDTAVDALLKGLGEQVYIMKVNMADSACGLLLVLLLTPVLGIYGYILCIWICETGNLWASIARLSKITGLSIRNAAAQYIAPICACLISGLFCAVFTSNLPSALGMALFAAIYLVILLLPAGKQKRNPQKADSLQQYTLH